MANAIMAQAVLKAEAQALAVALMMARRFTDQDFARYHPAGRSTTRSVELLRSPLMADLVRELKHFYPDRYVLFDLPPMLYADPLAFAPLVDGILLVVAAGSTPREEITRARESLQEFPVLGCGLNKIDPVGLPYNYHHCYPDRNSRKKFRLPWRN